MCLYEGVIVSNSDVRGLERSLRSSERRIVNVLEIKCLRSLVGMSRMDRVANEKMRE